MGKIEFLDQQGSFRVYQPEDYSGLYFPLAGDGGLKSCITPTLGGDSKRDQNHFLMEPVSIENLHNNKNTRNFWVPYQKPGILVSLRFVGRGRISADLPENRRKAYWKPDLCGRN